MERDRNKIEIERGIKQMLEYIERKPGMYLGEKDGRIDYLYYFLSGWFGNNDIELNGRYRAGIANYIYDWIINNRNYDSLEVEFSFLWYKMIYCITNTEEEAWKLFFKLSYEYLDYLEAEKN